MKYATVTALLALGLTGCNLNGLRFDVTGLPSLEVNGNCQNNLPQDGGGNCRLVWKNAGDQGNPPVVEPQDDADEHRKTPIFNEISPSEFEISLVEDSSDNSLMYVIGEDITDSNPTLMELGNQNIRYTEDDFKFVSTAPNDFEGNRLPSGVIRYGDQPAEHNPFYEYSRVVFHYGGDVFIGRTYFEANFDSAGIIALIIRDHELDPVSGKFANKGTWVAAPADIDINMETGAFAGTTLLEFARSKGSYNNELSTPRILSVDGSFHGSGAGASGVFHNDLVTGGFIAIPCTASCHENLW